MTERNVTQSMKKRVAAEQKWTCNVCTELLDMTYEIDHRIPLWRHGSNERHNLQVCSSTGLPRSSEACFIYRYRHLCMYVCSGLVPKMPREKNIYGEFEQGVGAAPRARVPALQHHFLAVFQACVQSDLTRYIKDPRRR
jgi:hypothetical protein